MKFYKDDTNHSIAGVISISLYFPNLYSSNYTNTWCKYRCDINYVKDLDMRIDLALKRLLNKNIQAKV